MVGINDSKVVMGEMVAGLIVVIIFPILPQNPSKFTNAGYALGTAVLAKSAQVCTALSNIVGIHFEES